MTREPATISRLIAPLTASTVLRPLTGEEKSIWWYW